MSNLDRLYKFEGGRLSKCDAPNWYRKAVDDDAPVDWNENLSRAGARAVESFGEVDALNVYRTPDDGFLVEYLDYEELVASVLINDRADYLTFRAIYLAPLASLIMQSDQHDNWRKEQNLPPK